MPQGEAPVNRPSLFTFLGKQDAQEQSTMVALSHVNSFRGSRAKFQSHHASLRTVRAERVARKGQERKPKTGLGPDL